MKNLSAKMNLRINMEIAIAMAISIYISYLMDLRYAAAAGIITLATVQNTRKETIKLSIKRLFGFVLMVILSIIIFNNYGFNVISYGGFVLLFAAFFSFLDMPEIISTNAVMATHFLDTGNTSMEMVVNETWIFVIGVGVGVVVNILGPVFSINFDKEKDELDTRIKRMFDLLQNKLRGIYQIVDKQEVVELYDIYINNQLKEIKKYINEAHKRLTEHSDNLIFTDENYMIEYFNMRKEQLAFLDKIFESTKRIDKPREESKIIADYINKIISEYHETNTVEGLLEEGANLREYFRKSKLPTDREEFESRARLYMILEDIISLLHIKRDFARSLTKEQIDKYWLGG